MNITPIRNEEDYDAALARVDKIFFAERGTPEFDELDILVTLIEAYEAIHYPMGEIDPIAAIKETMKAKGYRQKDLASILGSESRVSEILNRKRKPTAAMILALHEKLKIPLETLIRAAA
ncbi:MAG: transcriptional regulator [Hyphomonadaceae bacterium]|nr:MAG: transcriptional regulator [Hyphomonadaceae bacterium]KAF0183279.1 MAG: transcriptional regulator [Hyphomonadaceae bacterium]